MGSGNLLNQQTLQRHNFLMPKEDEGRGEFLNKKSSSPLNPPQHKIESHLNVSPY